MKRYKVIAVTLVMTTTLVTSSLSFAQGEKTRAESQVETQIAKVTKNDHKAKKVLSFHKRGQQGKGDKLQELQKEKAKTEKDFKNGIITEAQAGRMISHIDLKIKEIETFNSMTPKEKKDKLLIDFSSRINKFVKSGGLKQDVADQKVADYKIKLEQWDGNGAFPAKSGNGSENKNE